jgi:anti-anti-sigma factor
MINITKQGSVDIVTFNVDKINALITEEIKNEINPLFNQPNAAVIIDLTNIIYIDSSGFGCLLSILKTAKNNYGVMKLNITNEKITDMFKTLFLNSVFDIYNNIDECLKSF